MKTGLDRCRPGRRTSRRWAPAWCAPTGGDIAVFRTADDQVFALFDRCPHKGGPLSEGIVHGRSVTCPLHNWVISLETGGGGRPRPGLRTPDRGQRGSGPHPPRAHASATRRAWLTTSAPPAPIAASDAALLAGDTDGVRGDEDHPANFGRLVLEGQCARRDAGAGGAAAQTAHRRPRGRMGRGAGSGRRAPQRDHRAAWAGRGRVLCLGPVPDRGLLRRQQADEGLHRLRQHRHQFAPVHGLVGRRPPPRLRRGCGAGLLRGFRPDRPRDPGRIEHRLVPSDPLSTPAGGARPARHQDRRDRSAPHGDRGGSRSASAR